MPTPTRQDKDSILGYGPSFPLHRVGNDYEHKGGAALVYSSIPYILLTRGDGPLGQGEQPWDTEFGSQVHYLKHESLDLETLQGVAQHYIVEALAIHEPRLVVQRVKIKRVQSDTGMWGIELELTVSTIEQDNEQNDVRAVDTETISVPILL